MRRTVATHGDDLGHRAALCFIERKDGAILCVWNRRYHCWGLPGGKVEPGEEMGEAACRELKEETGLIAFWKNGPIHRGLTYSGSGRVCYTYEVQTVDLFPQIEEIGTGVAWMSRDFLITEPKAGPWFREFFAFLEGRQ